MSKLLSHVRLTYYYPVLFVFFLLAILSTHKITMSGGPLTLFSVNSFLLAFYLGPILSGQKQRIDELAKTVRSEAIAIMTVQVHARHLPDHERDELHKRIRHYLAACARSHKPGEGSREYEQLLDYCYDLDGKERGPIDRINDTLITNQQNRGQLSTLLRAGVYNHEWIVLLVLFSITISYVVIIDYGGPLLLNVVAALLCAGLTLLLLILQKLNSLTHKRAKDVWAPFDKLLSSNLTQID
jgi:hypothetical protein